ncbi:hypothetical protein HCN44_005737 [Aphidius gifuensis]|uniref:Gustatory receptor n=2 Tax=Aphidius gifuensis TaxID=684658 RepID=A0A834XY37_APHGI|nr:hypothetical protein HCN44_005737 [Aphidius gifuensis]
MTAIHAISTSTANLFSFPLLWITLYNSGCMLYSAYYMIMPFILESSEQTLAITIYSGFCFMFIFFSISIIAEKVESFKNEMKNTGDLVHKIMSRSTMNDKLQKELQQFARELLAYDVSFTSCNVFYLDGTLPFSIIGTIVTYLIILGQLG